MHKVEARARALVGTPFRPQGRSPEHGLDCLGLAAEAGAIPRHLIPSDYSLRSSVPDDLLGFELHGKLRPIEVAEASPGDVLLVQAGMRQQHFVLLVVGGFIHADLRLGRVVETPGPVPWPVRAAWRFQEL